MPVVTRTTKPAVLLIIRSTDLSAQPVIDALRDRGSRVIRADGEKLSGVYTNPIAATDLEDLDGLKFCPMIFQERIDKKLGMRAVVVGNRIFTAAVDSQSSEETKVDLRRGGAALAQS